MLTVPRQRRSRPSLTPLIDVVFLLLIFFMIVSRLSIEQQAPLTLAPSGMATSLQQKPDDTETAKLLLQEDGLIELDGASFTLDALLNENHLMTDQPIILTLSENVTFQQTLTALEALHMAGYTGAKLSTEGAAK